MFFASFIILLMVVGALGGAGVSYVMCEYLYPAFGVARTAVLALVMVFLLASLLTWALGVGSGVL